MRGNGHTLSRHPAALSLLIGAAILVGAPVPTAHADASGSGNGSGINPPLGSGGDETAFARPRRAMHGGDRAVALPQPLSPSVAAQVRRILAWQAHGNMPAALQAMQALTDPLLNGVILADRYLGRFHHSTASELSDWLALYPDHPDAPAIHALLLRRLPKGATPPDAPDVEALVPAGPPDPVPEDVEPPERLLTRNPALDRAVLDKAQRGNAAAALRQIGATHGLSASYAAQLRAEVAQVLFTQNADAEALRIATAALRQCPQEARVALPGYIGGLAAWRLDDLEQARTLFEESARAPTSSARLRAAAAFWAARASDRLNDVAAARAWLRRAAQERRTFHGILARRTLGLDTGILPGRDLLTNADVETIAATAHGWRAFALLQVGQPDRAEAELRALWPRVRSEPNLIRSLLLVASSTGLTDFAAQLATMMQAADGRPRDELRFPVPRLRPAGGFRVDPALIYGLARLESNFNPAAVSAAGARGLMQIMPMTAQFMAGDTSLAETRLHEPALNLELGQRYVAYLAQQDGIDNDLMRLLASYNAGPGNLMRWSADIRDGNDPLLFIEAIPIPETRAFVPHVLTYTWIYAARLHLPAPSLDELAAGEFPRFTHGPAERTMAANTPRPN